MVIIRTNSLFPALIWAGVLTIFSFAGCEGELNDNGEILPTDDAGSVEQCGEGQTLVTEEKADGTLMEICVPLDETDAGKTPPVDCPEGQEPVDFTPNNSSNVTVRCLETCPEDTERADCRKTHTNIPNPCCADICTEGETRMDISDSSAEFAEFACVDTSCTLPEELQGEVLCARFPACRLETYFHAPSGTCGAQCIDLDTQEMYRDYDLQEAIESCVPR